MITKQQYVEYLICTLGSYTNQTWPNIRMMSVTMPSQTT